MKHNRGSGPTLDGRLLRKLPEGYGQHVWKRSYEADRDAATRSLMRLFNLLYKLGALNSADNIYVGKNKGNIPTWWHVGMVFQWDR